MNLNRFFNSFVKFGTLGFIDHTGKTYRFVGETKGPEIIVRLHDKEIKRQLLLHPEMALGEGYMNGTLTIEQGTLYEFLELCAHNLQLNSKQEKRFKRFLQSLKTALRYFQKYSSLGQARKHVAHHYDLNDELYQLFLDMDRQYSCAYFKTPEDSLELAQENKKIHISKKLQLKKGQRVLDIGSGWGGLALHLAREYDVEVVGLTLSEEQLKVANQRAFDANLADRVQFYLRDYREEKGRYDRIVSVGMFEHVGPVHFKQFFKQVYQLLKEDGLMLLHSIGSSTAPNRTNAWIRKYIFPGGYCPSLSEVLPHVEKSNLQVTDIEFLFHHYADTLKNWRIRFMKNWDKAKALYDEKFCRMWEYYLASCEVGFRKQSLMVFQMQLIKNKSLAPRTREYIYKT